MESLLRRFERQQPLTTTKSLTFQLACRMASLFTAGSFARGGSARGGSGTVLDIDATVDAACGPADVDPLCPSDFLGTRTFTSISASLAWTCVSAAVILGRSESLAARASASCLRSFSILLQEPQSTTLDTKMRMIDVPASAILPQPSYPVPDVLVGCDILRRVPHGFTDGASNLELVDVQKQR